MTELKEIEFTLCRAIQNGIHNNSEAYPHAFIQMNGSLVIECDEDISKFQAFANVFPELCRQHGIEQLPDTTSLCLYEEITKDTKVYSKFTFNISPEDFDRLLMTESLAYIGYRNSINSGSILLLANPLLTAHKAGVICAFPVIVLEDHQVMPRIAGCNASELISTQLTYFITQYLSPEAYNHSTKRYGHWGAEITQCILGAGFSDRLMNVVFKSICEIVPKIYQQNMQGFDVISLRPEAEAWIQDIDDSNEIIYRLLGVVTSSELSGLKSLEIPVEILLNQLLIHIEDYLKDFEPGGERAPGGKSYYPCNEEYDIKDCKQLRLNIANISTILSRIAENKQDSYKSESNKFSFFQSSNEGCPASSSTPYSKNTNLPPDSLK